jgi:hypothetical protein
MLTKSLETSRLNVLIAGKKQTNHHRALVHQLTKGIIPENWKGYKVIL